jgi:hypothetical protein
MARRL